MQRKLNALINIIRAVTYGSLLMFGMNQCCAWPCDWLPHPPVLEDPSYDPTEPVTPAKSE